MKPIALFLLSASVLISACDQIGQQLGLDEPQRKEAKADAEGKAVGSACRQSGRAIEDCYSLYQWLPKASIFAGWREMNDYMQANNLGIVEPKLPPAPSPEDKKKKAKLATAESEGKSGEKKPESDMKAAEAKNGASAGDKPESKGLEAKPGAKDDAASAAKKDTKLTGKP